MKHNSIVTRDSELSAYRDSVTKPRSKREVLFDPLVVESAFVGYSRDNMPDEGVPPEEANPLFDILFKRALVVAHAVLTGKERECFLLLLCGSALNEIQEITGMSRTSVYRYLKNASEQVKRALMFDEYDKRFTVFQNGDLNFRLMPANTPDDIQQIAEVALENEVQHIAMGTMGPVREVIVIYK